MTITTRHNLTLEEMDKESLFHPYTALAQHMETGPKIMTEGQGVFLKDLSGREYLDGLAGLWCVNIGYGRPEIADAVAKQLNQLPYYHSFASMGTETPVLLADRVKQMAPGNMARVFFGCSGSDANDTQLKLVWYYNNLLGRPEKRKIIARQRGYHGVTVAAASLTGLPLLHKAFNLPIEGILHTEAPHHYWNAADGMDEPAFARHLAAALETMILEEGPETVAAFIAEPIMGAGGVIVPPETYFPEMQAVLRKYDVLMIADEVICGFGRTGKMFGSETFDIQPDMVSVAKGITSGYMPLSACIVGDKVWDVLLEKSGDLGVFGHGYTYSAHPVSCAAAMVNLDILEREDLVGNAASTGAYMQERLRETFGDHPQVGEVRGVGLIAAVEFIHDKAKKTPFDPGLKVAGRVAAKSLEMGLITRALPNGDSVALSPPLVITREEVDLCIERLSQALAAVQDDLVKEGVSLAA
ncbi:MAG: aspartate aminotransferase family protein [Rhodospirillales bacterium]